MFLCLLATGPSRSVLVAQWYAHRQELAIPVTAPAFSLACIASMPAGELFLCLLATGPSRSALVTQWYARCQELSIPVTAPACSPAGILSTPLELLEWGCQGLPSDAVSVENGLIATRGVRWPLMIDPQDQAYRCAAL
jgi:hypothetical protein